MTTRLADFVCDAPSTYRLGDVNRILRTEEIANPIDTFRREAGALVTYGTSGRLSRSEFLGGLLLLGLVSAAEAYFRSIISDVLAICPVCQACAAEKKINLGGLLWYGDVGLGLTAFDDLTFSGADGVRKGARGYLKFELTDAIFKGPLDEFERVCNLRHGIVHNGGLLPGKNAVQLGVPSCGRHVRIKLDYAGLQDIAAVVSNLVSLFNRELFEVMCERWAVAWRRRPDWNQASEVRLFNRLWTIFRSRDDMGERRGRSGLTRAVCLTEAKRAYGL